ncbi:MAG: AAA family ATPase [Actinobacteria bacterium]|nr:AAA family ATPase [Actinomycetota bacterium]
MQRVRIFELQNPWRQNKDFFDETKYIPRDAFQKLMQWIDTDDILVLLGARQTGKSTLLFKTIFELIKRKRIDLNNIFYFNLDNILLHSFFRDIPQLIDFLEEFGADGVKYLFIDEIQRLENCGLYLKQLYDLKLPLKIIVSGSSSLEIRSKIKESLTGRKKIFEMSPFSLPELVQTENNLDLNWELHDLSVIEKKERNYGHVIRSIAESLIAFGGYPKVFLQKQNENKIVELEELYSSYIEKDIVNFIGISNPEIFNKLILLLAHQIGNLVNLNELTASLQINRPVVQKYLFFITATYIADLLSPFYTNKRKEVIKSQKAYYLDCGLRNFIVDNFNPIGNRTDKGALVENFVYQEMKKQKNPSTLIKFWRTQNMAEIDFILTKADKTIPIKVKSGVIRQSNPGKAMMSFIKKYHPKYAYVLSENHIDRININNCQLFFLPYHWFLLQFNQILKLI